jgi:hypothetical protein
MTSAVTAALAGNTNSINNNQSIGTNLLSFVFNSYYLL